MTSLIPGHSQILSRSCGEKSAEGLGSLLYHGLEILYNKQFTADSNFMTFNTYTRRLILVKRSTCPLPWQPTICTQYSSNLIQVGERGSHYQKSYNEIQ